MKPTRSMKCGDLGANVLSIMKDLGFENSGVVDANWVAAYSAPFPNKRPGRCIEFPLDALLVALCRMSAKVPLIDNLKAKPAMLRSA